MTLRTVLPILALGAVVLPARPQAPRALWIEAENVVASTIPLEARGWGRAELLSGGTWVQVSVDAGDIEKKVPEDGLILAYSLNVAAPGAYALWNRIGYEFVRSPFDWRIDAGAWNRVTPETLTTDLQELQTWNEVAWLKLGDPTLSAGAHRLEIRLPRTKDAKGAFERILYASDAIALTDPAWRPYGALKPGEDHRTDRDRKAAAFAFALPDRDPRAPERTSLALEGDWEVCRADEALPPADIAVPMDPALPESARWSAIPVPSDKNASRPDLLFAHRLWYRTRVNVPASHAGRSLFLTFPRNNLNTTVVVNGVPCGFGAVPNAPFAVDITKAVRAGQVNEIRVGIRDAWYGYSPSPSDPMKLRRKFNLPLSVVGSGFQDLAYPIWNAWQSGIVQTPTLTSAGPVYAADVFVRPRVGAPRRLEVDVTLRNPGPAAASVAVGAVSAHDARTGAVAVAWKQEASAVTVPAGGEATTTLTLPWSDPKLWWPVPDPALYALRLTVGQDRSDTRFGFREWGVKGADFTLNGQVWHGWADLNRGATPAEWLKAYRAANQRFLRLSGYAQGGPTWLGLTPAQALDFFDRNGVVVRRSGDLDGEAIGYFAIENDPELRKISGTQIKADLMRNWRAQMVAQVRAERNHPSIHLWSIENEWLYINCINLYGNLMDTFEAAVQEVGDAVAAADPTRLWMTDGGGAGKANRFPVHGDHYVFDPADGRYPDLAYEANPTGGGRGRWTWDGKRPRYLGEDFFATGINPADYALLGGEAAFAGKAATYPVAGRIQRMLTEGYRWAGFGAWHLWLGSESAVGQYGSNADIAAFVRERDRAFFSGQGVARTVGVFNDAFSGNGALTLRWSVSVGGRRVAGGERAVSVPRGERRVVPLRFTLPTVARRTDGALALSVLSAGKPVFRDTQPLSVLPAPRLSARVSLYDPAGRLGSTLRAIGVTATPVASLAALPRSGVLVVGPDALSEADASSTALAAFAAGGGRVVVLEQKFPLRPPAIPVEIETSAADGRIAFLEDASHPALRGLTDSDLFTWGTNRWVYRRAYEKPVRGARSLVHCDRRLSRSALVEAPVGSGVLLLCQLTVGENAGRAVAARTLLANLVARAGSYRRVVRPAVAVSDDRQLLGALDAVGLRYERVADPLARPGSVAVVSATPARLKGLVGAKARLERFFQGGGWLVLHGLTPEGLADYNRLVGFEHMLRPFGREKVGVAVPRPALAAGISAGDVVQLSGKRIFPWTSDEYVSDDLFTQVVDLDEVSRFGKVPEPGYFGYGDATNDHNPRNVADGFTSADGWVFVFSLWAGSGVPKAIPMTFDRPQTFTELEWTGNAFYYPTTRIALVFDGKVRREYAVAPGNAPQTLAVDPPVTARKVEVQMIAWRRDKEPPIVGVEELRLRVARPSDFARRVRPLLDVGGMVAYPRGAGGVVLCNLNFVAREAVPVNAQKKQRLLAAVLRNLDASFGGGRTVIAGAKGLVHTPVDIAPRANQYRNERGWFGDPRRTFAALPTGRQVFAGVPFQVYDFPTSPVPTAVMLGGPGVPGGLPDAVRGIAVGGRADALFFLHTARVDRPRDDRERREGRQVEVARYVVTWEDGRTEAIPLRLDEDLADFRQKAPAALPGALLAWTRPFDTGGESATAWVKQWNNPRPEIAIRSVDLEYSGERRAVPALLAVTAARVGR